MSDSSVPARALRIACAIVALGVVGASPVRAQAGGGRVWYPLDAAPPGTPAEIVLRPQFSGPTQTTFDVTIHGFYVTPRTGPDNVSYAQLESPGLERLSILGAPEIPVVRMPLAIVTSASTSTLSGIGLLALPVSFHFHLWPQPVPSMEDSSGTPEVFTLDPAIYGSHQPYPTVTGSGGPTVPSFGALRASTIECHPFRWVPSRDSLTVEPSMRLTFSHGGQVQAPGPLTRDCAHLASNTYLNWPAVSGVVPVNVANYQGEYLFIYPSAYAAAIKPLATQKSIRGYTVTKMTTESLGSPTCASVRNAILSWYASTPSTHDHYCLLVGDINQIPFCPVPGGTDPLTDDLYGSADTTLPARTVFMGRLPVSTATDVQNEVKKIIDYEDHPSSTLYYGDVLLVARKPDGAIPDGDYPAQQESVRVASYKVTPNFFPYYGSVAGHNNAGVTAYLNTGIGITSYRGHGGPNEWWTWDNVSICGGYAGECYTDGNVNALSNGALTTVVWSIACDNSDLRDGGCMGRAWMTKFPGGAAAHYGSTRPSSTQDNDILEDSLFAAVWRYDVTKLGLATTFAEDKSIGWDYGWAVSNAWSYVLFGDPEMDVRRQKPPPWITVAPTVIHVGAFGGTQLDIQLLGDGRPVAGALISLWKAGGAVPSPRAGATPAGADAAGDDVFDNHYTGSDGYAHFTVDPQATGTLYYAARDSVGDVLEDSIAVVGPSAVGPVPVGPIRLTAAPSITRGATLLQFGRALEAPVRVRIFDVLGRPVAVLDAPRGSTAVRWTGVDAGGRAVRSGVYLAKLAGVPAARVLVVR